MRSRSGWKRSYCTWSHTSASASTSRHTDIPEARPRMLMEKKGHGFEGTARPSSSN
jgi:hypothetical protein